MFNDFFLNIKKIKFSFAAFSSSDILQSIILKCFSLILASILLKGFLYSFSNIFSKFSSVNSEFELTLQTAVTSLESFSASLIISILFSDVAALIVGLFSILLDEEAALVGEIDILLVPHVFIIGISFI